jgi:hypothetical protein
MLGFGHNIFSGQCDGISGLVKHANSKQIVKGKISYDYMAIGEVFSMGLILVPAQADHVK